MRSLYLRCLSRVSDGFRCYTVIRCKATRAAPMADEINKFAQYHPTTLTLQNFVDFGSKNASERKSFSFLRNELSVRLANIMKEICLLPEPLLVTPSVSQVEEWYEQSFEDMMKFQTMDPDASGTLSKFSEALDTILNRHSSVVEAMANGVMEMKEQLQCSAEIPSHVENCIQYFLDRFYMNRISIRMLIHQHLLLFTKRDRKKQYAEAIDVNCDIHSIVQDAYQNARFLCEQYYSKAPDCEIECHSPFIVNRAHNERIVMTYIPSHLHHMMFELMKNALRAVIEYHSGKSEQELPKVKVFICKGRKDMTIKLSDQGGGIRRSEVDLLFNYMYSTAPQPPSPDAADTTPIAGYGYGLPLSRLYAKYFNGNLWLNSVDGFGTDAMVCLKLLPQDASELLPIFNKTSFNKYMQPAQVGDWSDASNGFGRINSHNGHRL